MLINPEMILNYFIKLDNELVYKKLIVVKNNLANSNNNNIKVLMVKKFRINIYLFYLEILYTMIYNSEIFGTQKFYRQINELKFKHTNNIFLGITMLSHKSNIKSILNTKVKKLCKGITKYLEPLNDDELLDIFFDDPLWCKSKNNKANNFSTNHTIIFLDSLIHNDKLLDYYQWVYEDVITQISLLSNYF